LQITDVDEGDDEITVMIQFVI